MKESILQGKKNSTSSPCGTYHWSGEEGEPERSPSVSQGAPERELGSN